MSAQSCCKNVSRNSITQTVVDKQHNQTIARRSLKIFGGLASGSVLLLIPKCPVCLAAYVAMGTGIGISLSSATYLRISIITLCVAGLSTLARRN